ALDNVDWHVGIDGQLGQPVQDAWRVAEVRNPAAVSVGTTDPKVLWLVAHDLVDERAVGVPVVVGREHALSFPAPLNPRTRRFVHESEALLKVLPAAANPADIT